MPTTKKNPTAVALGKLVGRGLTKAERSKKATRAANIRWGNLRKKPAGK